MTMEREDTAVFYAPVPSEPDNQNYVVLPLYPHRRKHNYLCRCASISAVLLLLATAAYLLYPSDPDLALVRLKFNNIQVHTSPTPSVSLSLSLFLKVFNRDFFSLNYSSLAVSVAYRGQKLGHVTSNGGHVKARGTSYVNATLELDGFQVIHDVFYLVEDLAKGSIPFDTDSVVKGEVGLLLIEVPIKARISCEVYVNTNNQTIIRQDCYPE